MDHSEAMMQQLKHLKTDDLNNESEQGEIDVEVMSDAPEIDTTESYVPVNSKLVYLKRVCFNVAIVTATTLCSVVAVCVVVAIIIMAIGSEAAHVDCRKFGNLHEFCNNPIEYIYNNTSNLLFFHTNESN